MAQVAVVVCEVCQAVLAVHPLGEGQEGLVQQLRGSHMWDAEAGGYQHQQSRVEVLEDGYEGDLDDPQARLDWAAARLA